VYGDNEPAEAAVVLEYDQNLPMEETMKKHFWLWLALLYLGLAATTGYGESVRLGASGSFEFFNRPTYEEILQEFDRKVNLFPGFYWEVIPFHLGFGMTYTVKFDRLDSALAGLENEWYLDWIASWDFRYHFFRALFLDPFLELGFGSAGRVDITDYAGHGVSVLQREPLMLSLFGQLGGGVTFRLREMHAGGKLTYRFFNVIPPVTDFEPYPLKNFQFALFAGFSL
jgi:hypothetical protein